MTRCDDDSEPERQDGGNAQGVNVNILANKNANTVEIEESVKNKRFSGGNFISNAQPRSFGLHSPVDGT
jgi:hypothetical protein